MPREPVDASILNLYGCGSPDWAPVEVSIIPTSNPTDFLSNGYFILNGEGIIFDEFCPVVTNDKFPRICPSFVQVSDRFRNLKIRPDTRQCRIMVTASGKRCGETPITTRFDPSPPLPQVIRSSQYRPFRRSNTPTLPITRRSYFANYNDRPVDSHYAKRRHACSCDTGSPTNERASQLRAHTAKEVTNPVVRHDYSSNGVDGRLVCVNVCVCVRAVSNRN